jgi:hypothetical protein
MDKNLQELMLADLKKSNLTAAHAKQLFLKTIDATAMEEKTNRNLGAGYEIPYTDFNGKLTFFSRFKLFNPVELYGKSIKYWQQPKTPPQLYIPALTNWQVVLDNATQYPVWITEGEKKAAAMCALGFACVAVSGVWAWTSKRFHMGLLPTLKMLCPRQFTLCFDSDTEQNTTIKGALSALAVSLERIGGTVSTVTLPELKRGEKTGLDDFIVHHKNKKRAQKAVFELQPAPIDLLASLHALNDELMYVEQQQQFLHLPTMKFASALMLITTVLPHRTVTVYGKDGEPKQISAVAEWIKWPERRTVEKLVYAPGKPALTVLPDRSYNLWKGWAVEAKRGEVKPFNELLAFVGRDLNDAQRKWFLQWLAYPIQNPGAKMYTTVLIHSGGQGMGKTLIGYTLWQIYGDNFTEVTQDNLHSTFNSFVECKQFILGDEITGGGEKKQDTDRLKSMITREKVIINNKYQPTYELPDVINYMLTSNQADALYIENADRRVFIIEISGEPMAQKFYDSYDVWYRKAENAAAVFYHLQHVDLSGFNPKAKAPMTDAKMAMIEVSGTDAEGRVRDFIRNPKGKLQAESKPVDQELFTLDVLQNMLDPLERITRMQISKALRKQGAPGPLITTIPTQGTKALYPVANFEKWRRSSHEERVAHFLQQEVKNERRKRKLQKMKPTLPKANGANHP